MLFRALDAEGNEVLRREYYPVGVDSVLDEDDAGNPAIVEDSTPVRYPFHSGQELLVRTRETGLRTSDVSPRGPAPENHAGTGPSIDATGNSRVDFARPVAEGG